MRMTNGSYVKMNNLVGMCFNANAVFDNLAYNLDYHYFNEIGAMVHHNVAHKAPEWADMVSDKMLELGARPTRIAVGNYETEYLELKPIFEELLKTLADIRTAVRDMIDAADMDGDDEVRIFGEDFLTMISMYIKQAEEWINASNVLSPGDLNVHIRQYTHYIKF